MFVTVGKRFPALIAKCRPFAMAAFLALGAFMDIAGGEAPMIRTEETRKRLEEHVHALTVSIGERSIATPQNLKKAQDYIEAFYRGLGLEAELERYRYEDLEPANVIGRIDLSKQPTHFFILGAHYDSVAGTVGADDNASAVAVQLEVARGLKELQTAEGLDLSVEFASFALEEPPVFATRHMGSKVRAKKVRESGQKPAGMICLEMVGYSCREIGCQHYPFPLMFMGYPKTGDFIGIVGNTRSRGLTGSLKKAFQKNPDLPVVTLTVPFNGWPMPSVRLSDHAAFWDEGFPAVMVTDTAFYRNPYYHTPSDAMEKLDFPFMAELVESLLIFFSTYSK